MPKAPSSLAGARQGRRHQPLEDDLLATGPLREKSGKRKSRHEDGQEETFVDSKASRKILRIGQELADEDEASEPAPKPNAAFNFESRFPDDIEEINTKFDNDEAWGDDEEIVEEVELAPDDLAAFSKFFPTQEDPLLRTGWGGEAEEEQEGEGTNLADLILEKIAAHEASQGGNGAQDTFGNGAVDDDFEMPAKVVEVYTKYVVPFPIPKHVH